MHYYLNTPNSAVQCSKCTLPIIVQYFHFHQPLKLTSQHNKILRTLHCVSEISAIVMEKVRGHYVLPIMQISTAPTQRNAKAPLTYSLNTSHCTIILFYHPVITLFHTF